MRPAAGGRAAASALRRLAVFLVTAVLAAGLVAGGATAAEPRIGERLYIILFEHNPGQFSNALRTADEFLQEKSGRSFQIIMDYYGMFAAIQGVTVAQRDYVTIKRRNPGLTVIVCKETVEALARANKRRIPLLPGVTVKSCKGLREGLEKAGWRPALGF